MGSSLSWRPISAFRGAPLPNSMNLLFTGFSFGLSWVMQIGVGQFGVMQIGMVQFGVVQLCGLQLCE
jgi:hypothetical protein